MRKFIFTLEEFYHVYNRGIEKRDIFLNQRDYERFSYLLFACNDRAPLINTNFHYRGLTSIVMDNKQRELLTDIVCFCLMSNHFHLLLRERVAGGISLFMQKLGTAYTMYFNTKYERSGVLFQGTFKAVHVDREEYFTHLTRYIHLNPVELKEPGWKDIGIRRPQSIMPFIYQYKWSSCPDYLGKTGLPLSILNMDIVKKFGMSPKEYKEYLSEWTAEKTGLIAEYTLE